jgi:hypothetical protein
MKGSRVRIAFRERDCRHEREFAAPPAGMGYSFKN